MYFRHLANLAGEYIYSFFSKNGLLFSMHVGLFTYSFEATILIDYSVTVFHQGKDHSVLDLLDFSIFALKL